MVKCIRFSPYYIRFSWPPKKESIKYCSSEKNKQLILVKNVEELTTLGSSNYNKRLEVIFQQPTNLELNSPNTKKAIQTWTIT